MKKNGMVWLFMLILAPIISFTPVKLARSAGTTALVDPAATIFVDPAFIANETLQSGYTFTVSINISDVIDLYSYEVAIMWEPALLDATDIIFGDFFAGQPNFEFERVNNTEGWADVGQSIYGLIPGVNGSGWLFSIEFLVEDYGSTALTYDSLATYLLDSEQSSISFTTEDGYFSNKLLGDIDGDRDVDGVDFVALAKAYGTKGPPQVPEPQPEYNPEADLDHDGDVDGVDFVALAGNYGTSI